jgi:hypothetical protein
MKTTYKFVSIFICSFIFCSSAMSATNVIPAQQESHFLDGAVTVPIPVGACEIQKTGQGEKLFIENFGCLLIPGEPEVPARVFSIAIPPGARVRNVTFEAKNGILLGSYRILPCSLPRVMGQENPVLYLRDQQQYQKNYDRTYTTISPYPESIGQVVGTGGYREYNLVDVRITPCIYYPLSGNVMYYPDIMVTIHYTFPEGSPPTHVMVDTNPRIEQVAREIILNYDQAKNWYSPDIAVGREQFNYVIITLDSLTSSVQPLVDWENVKGKSVNVVTTSWINTTYDGYDLAAKIRAFLHEKYPSSEWGIEDVLFVGNRDDVPMRRMAQDIGYGQPETDFYYAELSLPDNQSWDSDGDHQYGETSDPIDFEAEVNVGRIPWSDPGIVRNICNKSLAYEQNNDPNFKKNILLLGAFFEEDTDNAVLMEYKVNASHNPWMSGWNKTRMYELGFSNYSMDYNLRYENVIDVWSTGTFAFVDWAGHGSPYECVRLFPEMTDFVNVDTCPYLSDAYPSIIFACACSNADSDYVNLGQAMMKQGGVGFVGSNKVAYGRRAWTSPVCGSSQTLDYYFTSFCTSGNYTQGAALEKALYDMYIHAYWYELRYETFEWGSLWGNPDLTMGPVTTSDPPLTPPVPNGPTHGKVNREYTFSSATTDPNGDQIYYMFDWGDGSPRLWLGPYPSGMTASAVHSWSVNGTYNITVKAKDSHNVSSHWSDPLPITIVLNDPPETPTLSGPDSGKPGKIYLFYFQTTDSDEDDVSYFVDWGDNTTTGWLGPYDSGVQKSASHGWGQEGTYTVKIKAKDTKDAESDWGILPVTIPCSYDHSILRFVEWLFDHFPHAFPMLRHVLKL